MKPLIVLVHGAWHTPEHYEPFVKQLRALDFQVYVPHLPSSGELAAQSSIEDDVATVSKLLDELRQLPRRVIVVAHSYGGAVATQALKGHLDAERGERDGRILHLIYMCGFMLRPGQSTFSASQPRPDPDPVEPGDDGTCFLNQSPRDLFYGDVEDGLVNVSEKLLRRHSLAALAGTIDYPAWKYVPTTYLRCTRDQVLFPEWQDRLIQAVRDARANLEVETFHASHSPYLSRTAEMVQVVERTASRYVEAE